MFLQWNSRWIHQDWFLGVIMMKYWGRPRATGVSPMSARDYKQNVHDNPHRVSYDTLHSPMTNVLRLWSVVKSMNTIEPWWQLTVVMLVRLHLNPCRCMPLIRYADDVDAFIGWSVDWVMSKHQYGMYAPRNNWCLPQFLWDEAQFA